MEGEPTEVTIWASLMQPGGLPPICVRTGEPAETWMRVRFQTAPRWTYWLLLLGVFILGFIPYFIVRSLVSVKATGQLPFTGRVAAWRRTVAIVVLLGLLFGIILFTVGAADNSGAVVGLGAVLFVGAVVFAIVFGRRPPRATVREQPGVANDRVVVLRGVHPNFARAVLMQQQMTAQQPSHTILGPPQ
jgi:hypothetical protein